MTDDSGQLSLDFLIGFTIFIVSFIFVVTMSSGLLVGLQSKTIDFDAVAYRTGVILVEDPGQPSVPSYMLTVDPLNEWELVPDERSIIRTGLAVSKETPNIISREKVNRFFEGGLDYRRVLMLNTSGGYPYRYHISLNSSSGSLLIASDPAYPEKHGYIQRAVLIKEPTDVTYNGQSLNPIILIMNFEDFYSSNRSTTYAVDALRDSMNLTVYNVDELTQISLNYTDGAGNPDPYPIPGKESIINPGDDYPAKVLINGSTPWDGSTPVMVANIKIEFPAGYFTFANKNSQIAIVVQYNSTTSVTPSSPYLELIKLNESELTPAILEVRIW